MPDVSPVILYVEDEENDLLFMELAFRKAATTSALRSVRTGQQAIAYLSGDDEYADRGKFPLPSLIVLDLNLPVLSGFDVLDWLRKKPEFKQMPVVVFSSSTRELDEAKARALGANDYLEKPTSGVMFTSVVRDLYHRWLSPAPRHERV